MSTNAPSILAINGLFTGFTLLVILARIYVRAFMMKTFGPDDYLVVAAMVRPRCLIFPRWVFVWMYNSWYLGSTFTCLKLLNEFDHVLVLALLCFIYQRCRESLSLFFDKVKSNLNSRHASQCTVTSIPSSFSEHSKYRILVDSWSDLCCRCVHLLHWWNSSWSWNAHGLNHSRHDGQNASLAIFSLINCHGRNLTRQALCCILSPETCAWQEVQDVSAWHD